MNKKYILSIILLFLMFTLVCSGCVHKHEFTDATCVEPKTCQKCGETEGEPLGHTVGIGKCGRCGEIVNAPDLFQLNDVLQKVDEDVQSIKKVIGQSASANTEAAFYVIVKQLNTSMESIEGNLQEAYDSCKNYTELSEIKGQIKVALNTLPEDTGGTDILSSTTYLKNTATFIQQISLLYEKVNNFSMTQ